MTTTLDDLRMAMVASSAAAGRARTSIVAKLREWGYAHISDDAALIMSELVANAAAATPRREIRLRLERADGGVLLAVWDSSDQVPRLRPVVELTLDGLDLAEERWDDNGGRGLAIVAGLAADYGHRRDPSGGKWVWARLDAETNRAGPR
jgi:anti-sigma regulatory factor (Ser/Thr protein kinase)